MEIDSGESREVAPETNCFAPFWEMGEGSAGYILWSQQVLDVSQLFPSPLRSVSASLVLGLHSRYRERYHVGPPQDCLSTSQRSRYACSTGARRRKAGSTPRR